MSREAWADNHLGDVADLNLMSQQQDLVDALLALGKPVVAVLMNGRPLTTPALAERVPAILEAWYAGQEGGTAIGEALFGDLNPGGKLPVTIPRHVGQLPVYYNRRPDVVPQSPRPVARAAVAVRSRPQLHDLRAAQPEGHARHDRSRRIGLGVR